MCVICLGLFSDGGFLGYIVYSISKNGSPRHPFSGQKKGKFQDDKYIVIGGQSDQIGAIIMGFPGGMIRNTVNTQTNNENVQLCVHSYEI